MTLSEHKGLYSRHYLPHLDAPGLVQAITFRLADSLPRDAADRVARDKHPISRSKIVERTLDAGHGSCVLRDPRAGKAVEDCMLWGDGERYRLLAWVVMPNHVHALIETVEGNPVRQVVQAWKSVSARQVNALLGRIGTVWQSDFHDRYIRDEAHCAAVIAYIEGNPIKAGLVARAEDWLLSSARRRRDASAKFADEDVRAPSCSAHGNR